MTHRPTPDEALDKIADTVADAYKGEISDTEAVVEIDATVAEARGTDTELTEATPQMRQWAEQHRPRSSAANDDGQHRDEPARTRSRR